MTSFQVAQWLRQGTAAAKAGDAERAYELLLKVVEVDEYNEQAWLWLSSVVESDADREVCLENVLAINPDNKLAKAGLEHLSHRKAQPAPPLTSEPQPPLPSELEFSLPTAKAGVEPAASERWDPSQAMAVDARHPTDSVATAPAVDEAEAEVEREKPRPKRRRRSLRALIRSAAIVALLALGLLAAGVAIVALLHRGPFDPTRRDYADAMLPLLADYDAWWKGPQGALVDELNSSCGPGADGWRNLDVMTVCGAHPSLDCTRLATHCGADVEEMRARVDGVSREAQQAGRALLAAFKAISPPDEIALAHARFLACLQARVAEAGRTGRLARGESSGLPDRPSACQLFSFAETQVLAYVGNP
jgi:hypothetical protein